MIYLLPIEPLEERYTEQWYRWFPAEFREQAPETEILILVGEPLCDKVVTGTFLDINSTAHYKFEQLKSVANLFYYGKVRDGDIFFVADIEFWGVEIIRYLADLNGVRIKLFGFCHAASYTREDFMAPCEPYAQYFERGWFAVMDKIFVGSYYHKRQMIQHRGVDGKKIIVTGNPYVIDEIKMSLPSKVRKRKQVILTNRPDPEKRPDKTLDAFEVLKNQHPQWKFLVTTSREQWGSGSLRERALRLQDQRVIEIKENLSKAEYFQYLAASQVMTSNTIEENFGYCVLESLIVNTVPIVPNDYSHPELVPDTRCLFNTGKEQLELIEMAMVRPFEVSWYAEKYRGSLARIVKECLDD